MENILDLRNCLQQKYEKALITIEIFDKLLSRVEDLKESIKNLSRVSETSVNILTEEGVDEASIILDGKKAIISYKKGTNTIIAERLDDTQFSAKLEIVVDDKDSITVYNFMNGSRLGPKKVLWPELFDYTMGQIFYDIK